MLEISIFCIILFAIAYWATLFIMGRREDVLHGQFVEADPELAPAGVPASFLRPVSPPPKKAASVPPTAAPPVVAVQPVVVAKSEPLALPALEQPAPAPKPATAPAPAAATSPEAEAWESLFASIKLELKNAAQI